MQKKIFVANWKEHKTTDEAVSWVREFATYYTPSEHIIVLCPSFTLLPVVKEQIAKHDLQISLGSQNFPAFDEGSYTGEESPRLLAEYIQYAIIGHSERRTHFLESDDMLLNKVKLARRYGIEPLYCVQHEDTDVPEDVTFVAYEPPFAIGSGHPDTPENANEVAKYLQSKGDQITVLYGGSVTDKNSTTFLSEEHIKGVLIGSQSLDPQAFSRIIYT